MFYIIAFLSFKFIGIGIPTSDCFSKASEVYIRPFYLKASSKGSDAPPKKDPRAVNPCAMQSITYHYPMLKKEKKKKLGTYVRPGLATPGVLNFAIAEHTLCMYSSLSTCITSGNVHVDSVMHTLYVIVHQGAQGLATARIIAFQHFCTE